MKRFFEKIAKMNVILFYCITTTIYVVFVNSVCYVLDKNGVEYSQNVVQYGSKTNSFISMDGVKTKLYNATHVPTMQVVDRIGIPFTEEFIFRWLPLLLIISVFRILISIKKKKGRDTAVIKNIGRLCIIIVVLVGSVVFGYIHGNAYNILIQGPAGLIFYISYLRVYYRRRLAGKKCYLQIYPLLATTLYHVLVVQLWRVADLNLWLDTWYSAIFCYY